VTFDTGNYIFDGTTSTSNALSVANSSTLQTGSGGALLYIDSGTVRFANTSQISLAGEAAYQGVALWDPAATLSTPLTLAGSSGVTATYGGIYVPNGAVSTANSAVISAAFIVADEVALGNSSQLFVG
jgi:hypothetical protein